MPFHFGSSVSSTSLIESMNFVKEKGGNFVQIFVNPSHGKYNLKVVEKYEKICDEINEYCENNNFKIVIHSPYTLNFGKELLLSDIQFLTIFNELTVAHLLNAIGCVIHVGKYLKLDESESIENMFTNIKRIIKFIKKNELNSVLILETSAGQGTELFVTENNSLDPLLNFYNRFTDSDKQHFKLCIDTCHINSAGFCINTKENVKNLFNALEESGNIKDIALIHFNDSKTACCSRVDRHESLGHGTIGATALSHVLRKAIFYNIPCVLETPSDNHENELLWMSKIVKKYGKRK